MVELIGFICLTGCGVLICTYLACEDELLAMYRRMDVVFMSIAVSWLLLCAGIAIGAEFHELIMEYSRVGSD